MKILLEYDSIKKLQNKSTIYQRKFTQRGRERESDQENEYQQNNEKKRKK